MHVDQVPETHLPDTLRTVVSTCDTTMNTSLNSSVRVGSLVTLGHFPDQQPRHASADPQRLRQTALPCHPPARLRAGSREDYHLEGKKENVPSSRITVLGEFLGENESQVMF